MSFLYPLVVKEKGILLDRSKTRPQTQPGLKKSQSFCLLFVPGYPVLPCLRPSAKVPDSDDQERVLPDLVDDAVRKPVGQAPACPFG